MSQKVNNLEKLFVGMVIVILTLGFILHKGLQKSININKEVLVSSEEKDYINKFIQEHKVKNLDVKGLEIKKTYLSYLEDEKVKNDIESIAKVNYFLGLNSFFTEDYENAIKYFLESKKEFKSKNNYFYTLNINNYLINVFSTEENYVEELRILYENYQVLKSNEIKGLNEKELEKVEINTIAGLLKISALLEMTEISDVYYQELLDLTSKSDETYALEVYAKYFYNFKIKNFELAERYAKEFISVVESVEKHGDPAIASAQMPLLKIYMENGELEKAQKPFNIINKVYGDKRNRIKGTLLMIEGRYLQEKKKDFNGANKFYQEAIEIFEEIHDNEGLLQGIESIIKLRGKIEIDLNYYINKAKDIYTEYNHENVISEIADILNIMSREQLKEEQSEIIKRFEVENKVILLSNIMRFLYILIIILLVVTTSIFKKEVSKRQEKEKEIRKMMKKDFLTQAYTKEFILEKMKECMLHNEKFTFLLIDIDNFKKINNSYGYSYGDKILKLIVEEVKGSIVDFGYIGRVSGDEFIILLNENVNARLIISLIKGKVNNINSEKTSGIVTLSGGGLQWKDESIDELFKKAGLLLMEAKLEGKDKFILE
ncbi:MAG: tetratricopeptide repeat-containing diguanylate cyclase [Sarcina sp.]